MHKDFYSHLVVPSLEKPLKPKGQLGVQEYGLTCLNDLLDHNKGFFKVRVPYDGGQSILQKKV